MANGKMEQLLNEIGQLLAEDSSDRAHETLLHAELDNNLVATSIFDDLGDHIQYRDAELPLNYALLDLWEAQEPDKRWAELEYLLRDGKFRANFIYPEEIEESVDPLDRRDRIVERYFGKKPISYPPPPGDTMEFKD